jgi:hypothetical protein
MTVAYLQPQATPAFLVIPVGSQPMTLLRAWAQARLGLTHATARRRPRPVADLRHSVTDNCIRIGQRPGPLGLTHCGVADHARAPFGSIGQLPWE